MKQEPFEIKDKFTWLYSRGGRTLKDVYKDKKGEFVYMSNGTGGTSKVYLPKFDNKIDKE